MILWLLACEEATPSSEVLTLEACPEGTLCEQVADGASLLTVQACIPDEIEAPWRAGDTDAPDMTLTMNVVGATWRDGTTAYTTTLGAQLRCAAPEVLTGTTENVRVEASFLGDLEVVELLLTPTTVDHVELASNVTALDPTVATAVTVSATVYGPGGRAMSEGTSVAFSAVVTPDTLAAVVTPSLVYLGEAPATATIALPVGVTAVTITATATPPEWDPLVPVEAGSASVTLSGG